MPRTTRAPGATPAVTRAMLRFHEHLTAATRSSMRQPWTMFRDYALLTYLELVRGAAPRNNMLTPRQERLLDSPGVREHPHRDTFRLMDELVADAIRAQTYDILGRGLIYVTNQQPAAYPFHGSQGSPT